MIEQGMHEHCGSAADTAPSLSAHAGQRSAENRYRRLFETAKHGILLLNFDTAHIEDSNPHLAQMLGYPDSEFLGKKLWEALPFRNSALDAQLFGQLQRTGHLQLEELTLETGQGARLTVEFSAHVYEQAGSSLIQCHIRHLAAAEDLARQLEITSRDLESFSHTVTHDLRSPLGQIDGFAYLLGLEYADSKLDAKAQGYIQRIRGATKQMLALIDDLWGLTRISRAETHPQPIDLSDMAQALALDLQPMSRHAPQSRRVECAIAPGLTAVADIDLMRMALDNLFKNAAAFSAGQVQPRIEFGALHSAGKTVYCIKDNGAGFDLADNVPLFTQLQRMNSLPEFDGAGIRFAKAERAIQRQGGKIWAESAAGQGAAFYFTLGQDAGA